MHLHVLFFFKYILASALFEEPIFSVINVYLFNPQFQLIFWFYHKLIVCFFHRDHPFSTQGFF